MDNTETDLAVIDPQAQLKTLATTLPAALKGDVLALERPTGEQMHALVEKLPDALKEKMLDLVRRANPKKQGVHTEKASAVSDMKLYQGTGTDPMRPDDLAPGFFYSDGESLGKSFKGIVIHLYTGRTLWPPRDESDSRFPICVSYDRRMGSQFGRCNTCPKAALSYSTGGCAQEVVVHLLPENLSGIYSLRFSRSSASAGANLAKLLGRLEAPYMKYVQFDAVKRENTEKKYKWFIVEGKPLAGSPVDVALHPLLQGFSRIIDADIYWPTMSAIYGGTFGRRNDAAGDGTPALDQEALLNGAAPDFSKGVAAGGGNDNPDI